MQFFCNAACSCSSAAPSNDASEENVGMCPKKQPRAHMAPSTCRHSNGTILCPRNGRNFVKRGNFNALFAQCNASSRLPAQPSSASRAMRAPAGCTPTWGPKLTIGVGQAAYSSQNDPQAASLRQHLALHGNVACNATKCNKAPPLSSPIARPQPQISPPMWPSSSPSSPRLEQARTEAQKGHQHHPFSGRHVASTMHAGVQRSPALQVVPCALQPAVWPPRCPSSS